MTATLSINYELVWQIKGHENYQFTQCGKCFNTLRGKELRRILNGRCEGFCINGRFTSLKQIRPLLLKINDVYCPF